MEYIVFNNTPAHVHLYKNAIKKLQSRGHVVHIFARDNGVTTDLLEYYNLSYDVFGSRGASKYSAIEGFPKELYTIRQLCKQHSPDLIFGVGIYASYAGLITNKKSIIFDDSDTKESIIKLATHETASAILSPYTYDSKIKGHQYLFDGLNECAYLHPNEFQPDENIREELGVDKNESYFVLRFNAFGATHDVGVSGFSKSDRDALVATLKNHGKVFISDEELEKGDNSSDFHNLDVHPGKIHDVLFHADLLIADTQTMVTEAALLGTPAIRSNSFVGNSDMGNFIELEEEGLIYNVENIEEVMEKSTKLLNGNANREWMDRRSEFLSENINVTDMIVDIAEEVGSGTDIQTVMDEKGYIYGSE